MPISALEEVMSSGEAYRPWNWEKHRDHEGQPYPYWNAYPGLVRLERGHVFADFAASPTKGVISAIKWGYPKGGLPGGRWQMFSTAFRSGAFEAKIAELRRKPGLSAVEIITALNAVQPGIKTASTSKLAYFAGLTAREGQCMIYDAMVRRAIRERDDPEFAGLKAMMPVRDLSLDQQQASYGDYIRGLEAMARRCGTTPVQVEHWLFCIRQNGAHEIP